MIRARARVAKLEQQLDAARAEFYEALRAAKANGMTNAGIARVLGITRERVKQLLNRPRG